MFVAGGVIEVQPHQVTVLADTAVRSEDLDHAKVEKAIAEAREARKNASGADAASLDNELALLVAQLAAIKKLSMH